jgi:hypothetical protein
MILYFLFFWFIFSLAIVCVCIYCLQPPKERLTAYPALNLEQISEKKEQYDDMWKTSFPRMFTLPSDTQVTKPTEQVRIASTGQIAVSSGPPTMSGAVVFDDEDCLMVVGN